MATCWPSQEEQRRGYGDGDRALPSPVYGFEAPLRRRRGRPPAVLPPPTEMSSSSVRSAAEESALRVHSEAERRRRERINAHLSTLRAMIPDAMQMDKATLLARVVSQVKHLKKNATEAAQATAAIPGEADEVTVQCYAGDGRAAATAATYMRASISCDDRPSFFADVAGALSGLGLRAVRADMTALGGRARHVFMLCDAGEEDEEGGAGFRLASMKEAVRQALANVAFPEMVYSGSSSKSKTKRQKMLESQHSTPMNSI